MKKILFLLLITLSAKSQVGFLSSSYLPQRAINFYTATGITNNQQRSYIYYISKHLEARNKWDNYRGIYPFVGGTAFTHSYNLWDTSLYKITWFGGMTHDANGITGNGTNAYGNTNMSDAVLSFSSHHFSVYNRTNTNANVVDIGTTQTNRFAVYSRVSNQSWGVSGNAALNDSYQGIAGPSASDGRGFNLINRTANDNAAYWRNGSVWVSSSFNQGSLSMTSANVIILGAGTGAAPVALSNRNLAFASTGFGLDDVAIYSAMVDYAQSILNRKN